MTNLQIAYYNATENKRHNLAQEDLGYRTLAETTRHNISTEDVAWYNAYENSRHNLVTEDVAWYNAEENNRHNLATEENATQRLDYDKDKFAHEYVLNTKEYYNNREKWQAELEEEHRYHNLRFYADVGKFLGGSVVKGSASSVGKLLTNTLPKNLAKSLASGSSEVAARRILSSVGREVVVENLPVIMDGAAVTLFTVGAAGGVYAVVTDHKKGNYNRVDPYKAHAGYIGGVSERKGRDTGYHMNQVTYKSTASLVNGMLNKGVKEVSNAAVEGISDAYVDAYAAREYVRSNSATKSATGKLIARSSYLTNPSRTEWVSKNIAATSNQLTQQKKERNH